VLSGTKISKIDILNTFFKDNGIDDMYASSTGSLFIINKKGLYVLPLDNNNINLKNAKLKIDFIKSGISLYTCIMEDKNMILIGSDKGLFAFKNKQFMQCVVNLNDKKTICSYKIVKDQYGYYWVGDYNYGLYRLHLKETPGNIVEFDSIKEYKCPKPDSSFVTMYVGCVTLDHNGYLWMSSFYTGVYKLKIDKSGVTDYKLYAIKNGLSGNYVEQIEEDSNHNIWIITKRGANCIKPGNNGKDTILNFNSKKGLGDEVLKIVPTIV
jgi:ligand-binding sensor domain-containing protein